MKSGIVRKIDELGRIVIPKEIRKSLKLNTGDVVEIFVENNRVYLKKFSTLLGLHEELFNIAKVINEQCNCSILFVDDDKIIVSYGKYSEKYIDKIINKNLYYKVKENEYIKLNNIYIVDDYIEDRIIYLSAIYHKKAIKGLLILIENDKNITPINFEIINNFKKFIIKQLDS